MMMVARDGYCRIKKIQYGEEKNAAVFTVTRDVYHKSLEWPIDV